MRYPIFVLAMAQRLAGILGLASVLTSPSWSQDAAPAPAGEDQRLEVAKQQRQLADRFAKLEELFLRMSELESTTNPGRAGLLQQAAKLSKELALSQRMVNASDLLDKRMLSRAIEEQKLSRESLTRLLTLLQSENRQERVRDERKRIEEAIKEIQRMQRIQQGLRGRTENGQDLAEASNDQSDLARQAEKLKDELKVPNEADSTQEAQDKNAPPNKENASPKNSQDQNPSKDQKPPAQDQPGNQAKSADKDKPSDKDGSSDPPQNKQSPNKKSTGEKSTGEKSSGDPSPSEKPPGKKTPSQDTPQDPNASQDESSSQSGDENQKPTPESREQNAKKRLQAAQQRMEQAQKEMKDRKRQDAVQRQREAEKELKAASEELERILRQLREEEIERSLEALEVRFRKMLTMQNSVLDETRRVQALQGDQRDRQLVVQSNKLSLEEKKIVEEGQRALLLLQDEGSSMAFPEAVLQIVADAQSVAERLGAADVSTFTVGIQEEIVRSLEELIESLKQVQKQQEQSKQSPPMQGQPPAGERPEKPLVDALSELRLVKTLQLRINSRTTLLSTKLSNPSDAKGQATDADLRKQLKELSERQERLQGVTRDIFLKLNEKQ
jgi:hypothetical protein